MIEKKDKSRGLYGKFHVERTDGESEPMGKHQDCHYFVLDVDCDPHAKPALEAYADSCQKDFPKLATDLRANNFQKLDHPKGNPRYND